jgi:hypothetical protein
MATSNRNHSYPALLVGLTMFVVACTGGNLPGTSTTATPTAAPATTTATLETQATTPSQVSGTIVTQGEVESLAPYAFPRVRTEVSEDTIQCSYYFVGDHVGALVGVAISSLDSLANAEAVVESTLAGIEDFAKVTREQVPGLGDEAWFVPEIRYQADLVVRVGLRVLTLGAGAGERAATMDAAKAYIIALAKLAVPRLP